MLSSLFPIMTTAIPRRKIQLQLGEGRLGIFSSIFTPTVLITTLAPALILAIIPSISLYWKREEKKAFSKTVLYCYLICIGITFLAEIISLICGKFFLKLLFDEDILQYINLLYWAIASTGLNAMTSCGSAVLISLRLNKIVAITALMSTIFVYLSSTSLVTQYDIYGASYALFGAYLLQTLAQIVAIVFFVIKK